MPFGCVVAFVFFFFFNDTATTEIYTLSLHDALPISRGCGCRTRGPAATTTTTRRRSRSEEHTSELQSQSNLVCRLLLEKKKKHTILPNHRHLHYYPPRYARTHTPPRIRTRVIRPTPL